MRKIASKIKVKIGNRVIGGGEKVLIQSMTNTKTFDVDATVNQIKNLEKCGCEIVRATVNNEESAEAIYKIKEQISPLFVIYHFVYIVLSFGATGVPLENFMPVLIVFE